MKKTILYALAAVALAGTSCTDMLDKSPRDRFINNPEFWNNTNQVESFCNTFYNEFIGYGIGGGSGWFYFKSLSDDQANNTFDNWTYTTVPGSSSDWSGHFTEVRRASYALQGLKNSKLSNKAYFEAIARLNRAWHYYQLVRMYGDVQWINTLVNDPTPNGADKDVIMGKRTDRDVVMDSVLVDLDFAIANLPAGAGQNSWSKEMATAMKSDICLYEGTYAKYRTEAENGKPASMERAEKYLKESVAASEAIMASKKFELATQYGDIYNSTNLAGNKEVIFYKNYEKDVHMHGLCDWTSGSTTQRGISKDLFDAFLFLDGKPLATTGMDKSDKVKLTELRTKEKEKEKEKEVIDTIYTIQNALAVRDKRLSVLIDSVVCFKGYGWARLDELGKSTGHAEMTSSTGYTIKKFDNTSLPLYYRANTTTSYTDAPLYWYAVILLNEAEAKAELGTISQTDLDNTVNLLQARAGLKGLTTSPGADPANNHGVSNLLWEIRRARRCELALDNWYRYWDLVRWHQLDKLDSNKYPNINRGANLTGVKNPVKIDDEGYIIATGKTRAFDAKYYFYPIPSNQISLNKETTQNPGWVK